MTLRVLEPGLCTTVQDLGRPGHGLQGVSASGAADPLSLRLGNLLVGNGPDAAALELTLLGGALQVDEPTLLVLAGSDFGASVGARPVPPWSPRRVRAGETLRVGSTRSGARAYLCVRGGIAVPALLGSRSTHLLSGLGGLTGRALRGGDRLELGAEPTLPPRRLRVPAAMVEALLFRTTLRITWGPQEDWFTAEARATVCGSPYAVTEAADRMGLRLSGPSLTLTRARQLLTEGVCLGAIQVPESGQPIILAVEQQTTGGYPKIANVIAADLPALGQLRPRQQIRFQAVTLAAARALYGAQERLIAGALEAA